MELTKPPTGSHRSWLWGLGVAWGMFVLLLGIGFVTASWGYIVVLGVPILVGYTMGRWLPLHRMQVVVIPVAALGGVITAAVTTNLAGAICGAVIGVIVCVPVTLGVAIGSMASGNVRPTSTIASVAFVALLIPLEHAATPTPSIESVSTVRVVDMTPMQAFERIRFFEDTSGIPPRLVQIALPRPIRTEGDGSKVGGRQRCIYDIGYLVKEITEVEPGKRYAFRVIEQVGVESHSVALTTGSFDFEPVGRDHTRIVLTTSYRPKLGARLAWRPFEQAVIHRLHDHVMTAMTR